MTTGDAVSTLVCAAHVRKYSSRIGAFGVEYIGNRAKPPQIYYTLLELSQDWREPLDATIIPEHETGA